MIAEMNSTAAALARAMHASAGDGTPRLVLADWWEEEGGRPDVAAMLRGNLPERKRTRKRVESMSAAEKAAMPLWAEKWIKIGLSTEPADRPMFEAAATQCYLAAGLAPPRFAWCQSPLVAVTAGVVFTILKHAQVHDRVGDQVRDQVHAQVHDRVGDQVRDQVHAQVHDRVGAQVCAQVRAQIHDQVYDRVGDQVRDHVHDQVHDQVRAQIHDQVHDRVGAQVRAQVRAQIHDQVHDRVGDQVRDQVGDLWCRHFSGQFWAGWYWWWSPASVTFALDVLRLDIGQKLELAARAYAATTASACWWWPHREVVFVSERPHTLTIRKGQPPVVLWEGWGIGEKT